MSAILIRDLMTTDLVLLSPKHDFVSSEQLMRLRHVRHLPVVDAGKLVGLVTQRDLMRAQARLLVAAANVPKDGEEHVLSVRVRDFMTTEDLLTVSPETPADEAAGQMMKRKIGCVLVVEGDALVGIATEADFMRWAVAAMSKGSR